MTTCMTRWTLVALILSAFLLGPSSAQQTAEPPLADPPPGARQRAPQTAEPPLAAPNASAPNVGAPNVGAPNVAVPTDARAQLTETVGLLSGLYLYQTYLNVGLLADGKAERLYDEKAARAVLKSVLTPLDAVHNQLSRIGTLAETAADRDAAARLLQVVGLLRRQGQELVAFWDTGRAADGARYEATRQEVWRQLSALLKLDQR
jgi:hypothetical protein